MPIETPAATLQGLMAGANYDLQKQKGAQAVNLENLMSRNRVEEGMTEVPQSALHPSLHTGLQASQTPGMFKVRASVLPTLEKASETLYGRENRVAQAKNLAQTIATNAPAGDEGRAHRAFAANLLGLAESGDVDPKLLEQGGQFLNPEVVMGKPGEVPLNKRSGAPIGPAVPIPTLPGESGGASGPTKTTTKVGTSGVEQTTAPMGDASVWAHRAALSRGLKEGSPAYNDFMLANATQPLMMGPDSQAVPRGQVPIGGVSRQPTSTPAETEKTAAAQTEIQQLKDIATVLDQMDQLKDWPGRASFLARAKGTSMSHGILDLMQPGEREAYAAYGMLRTMYERSQAGGSSIFRSPSMVAMLNNTIGGFTMPGQGNVLRKLAQMGEEGEKNLGAAQTAGGRRNIADPSKTPGAVVPTPKSPETTGGSPASAGVSGTSVAEWKKKNGIQ